MRFILITIFSIFFSFQLEAQFGASCVGCGTRIVNQQGGVSQIGLNATQDTIIHNDGNGLVTLIPLNNSPAAICTALLASGCDVTSLVTFMNLTPSQITMMTQQIDLSQLTVNQSNQLDSIINNFVTNNPPVTHLDSVIIAGTSQIKLDSLLQSLLSNPSTESYTALCTAIEDAGCDFSDLVRLDSIIANSNSTQLQALIDSLSSNNITLFTVNGVAPNGTGTATVEAGGFINFSSSDSSVIIDVTQGSANVDLKVDPNAIPPETVTNLVDNNNGTFTYTNEDNQTSTFSTRGQVNSWSTGTGDYNLLGFPPAQPQNAHANPDSSHTNRERYDNGYASFTHNGTEWVLTTFETNENQKFTCSDERGQDYIEGSLSGPQNPPANPSQADTHFENYDNAIVIFNYQEFGPGAGWDGNNICFIPLDTYVPPANAALLSGTHNGDDLLAEHRDSSAFHFHTIFGPVTLNSSSLMTIAINETVSQQAIVEPLTIPQGVQGWITKNASGELTVHYTTSVTTASTQSREFCFTPSNTSLPTETIYEHYTLEEETFVSLGYTLEDIYVSADEIDISVYQGGGTVSQGECPCDCTLDYTETVAYTPFDRNTQPGTNLGTIGSSFIVDQFSGALTTESIVLRGLCGEYIPATISFQHVSGTGSGNFVYDAAAQNVLFHGTGGSDFIITIALDDPTLSYAWGLWSSSIGVSEALNFNQGTAVTSYDQGGGGINLTLPYSGSWHNNNNNAYSALGFDPANSITFRKNGSTGAGGNIILALLEGPGSIDLEFCDLIDSLDSRVTAVESKPQTIDIDCYNSDGLVNILTDNTALPQIGTISYNEGIYISSFTGNVGVVQITIENNSGTALTNETLRFVSDDTGVQLGVISDPFDVPVGTNVITVLFSTPLAFDALDEYDGQFSTISPANILIPYNRDFNNPHPVISSEIGDNAPIALLAESIANEEYNVVTSISNGQITTIAYNSQNVQVPLDTANWTECVGLGSGGNTSIVSNTVLGKIIATHDDGQGSLTDIRETITTVLSGVGDTLFYVNENGDSTLIREAKEISDCVETREISVSIPVPGDYTLVRDYSIDVVNSDNSTTSINISANADATATDQAIRWANEFNSSANIQGTWTANGTNIEAVFAQGTIYPVDVNATIISLMSFNSGASPVETLPDEQWTQTDSDLSAVITLGTVNTLNGTSGGNGILAGESVIGSPDNFTVSSTFPGWPTPSNIRIRVNDLDPGPNEFVEFSLVPDSVSNVQGGGNFTLTGSRVDPLINNVDVYAHFNNVTSVDMQQRAFVGGSNRIGYVQVRALWDFDLAIIVNAGTIIELTRCGDIFINSVGDTIPEPAEYVACGTYDYADGLNLSEVANLVTQVSELETYQNDNYIQRGEITMTNNIEQITLPEAYLNTNYTVQLTTRDNQAFFANEVAFGRTTSGFQISAYDENGANVQTIVQYVVIGTKQ